MIQIKNHFRNFGNFEFCDYQKSKNTHDKDFDAWLEEIECGGRIIIKVIRKKCLTIFRFLKKRCQSYVQISKLPEFFKYLKFGLFINASERVVLEDVEESFPLI